MGKVYAFLLGLIAGFGVYHLTSWRHVVRADDGLHLLEKTEASLTDTYVDIREFNPQDWLQHPRLAAAILESDDEELKTLAIDSAVEQGLRRALDFLPRQDDPVRPRADEPPAPQNLLDADIPAIDVPNAGANGAD